MSPRAKSKKRAAEGVVVEKQSWNVYSSMLLVSLLALLIGCFALAAELSTYDWKTDPTKMRSSP